MKILILSDSHRATETMDEVFAAIGAHVDAVIFLGDCYDDILPYKDEYDHIPFYAIAGNSELSFGNPEEGIVELGGKRVFFCHGHRYGVKSGIDRISKVAIEKGADVCLFGHTHAPHLEQVHSVLVMNPGSISQPRGVKLPSYGMLDIEAGVLTASIVERFGKGQFRLRD